MNAWQAAAELLRTVLLMSISGSISALLLFAIKPLIKNHLPKAVQFYLWTSTLIALLVPFSLFVSIPVNTPMAPVQKMVEDTIKTNAERYEEASQQKYSVPFEELEAVNQVGIIFESKGWLNSYLLTAPFTSGITIYIITVFQYLCFVWKLRHSLVPAKDSETAILRQLHKGSRTPRLYRSRLAPTPMLIGLFRPAILLPDRAYSDAQLQNILLHELTHLRRYDILVKWFSVAAVSLHWFNPLVYFIRREIDRACELSCDEAVIKRLDADGRQSYGDTLIAMVADTKTPRTVLSTTMCEEKRALRERLGSIMKHKGFPNRVITFSCVLVAAVLCGTVVLGAETTDKVTAPAVSIYDGNGSVLLTAAVDTGVIGLPASVEVQAAYRDNTSKSRIVIYCAPIDSDAEPRSLGGASRDVSTADDVKITTVWHVAEAYPDGFDGYVWAVATGADDAEHKSDLLRVIYDPAGVRRT